MNPFLEVLLLALVQGLTEFLPISSSGHLVLAQAVLGFDPPGVALELTLHLGTLLAVVIYYRRDLLRLIGGSLGFLVGRRGGSEREEIGLALRLALGTVPAVVAALLVGDLVEAAFSDPRATCGFLMLTGILLLATLRIHRGTRRPGALDAVVVGLFQAVSLLPGISRSGSTIAGGLIRGLRPEEAARFSFLLSVPAILGAAIFKMKELSEGFGGQEARLYLAGFAVSFVVGYLAIDVLLRVVRRGRFGLFGIYCLLIGGIGMGWFLSR